MKIVVGLGNPGAQYAATRHNIGFDVLTELAKRFGSTNTKSKFNADIREIQLGNEKLLLVAPQTFMNLSGQSVQPLVKFYQADLKDLLVICDDLNLPVGQLRLRASGSAGGQKGLQNILQVLATEEVPRLRVGISRPPGRMDAAAYVLAKYTAQELPVVQDAIGRSADAVEEWAAAGLDSAMNRFNRASDESER